MTMTVSEIQGKQFHVRFRGFDIEEVDAFLEKAAISLQTAQDENLNLAEQLKEMEKELSDYQRQRKSFQSAIMAAQNITEQMKEKSRREAEEILVTARAEAQKALDAANADVEALRLELDRLQTLRITAQEELRQQLTSYLAMVEPQNDSVAGAGKDMTAGAAFGASFPSPDQSPKPAAAAEKQNSADAGALGDEDDLSDLYTRIDLPDDDLLESADQEENLSGPGAIAPQDKEYFLPGEEREEAASVPDLDGDMVFTLDDPLDHPEPSFSLTEEERGGEGRSEQKKDLFSPDDSPL